MKSQFYFVTNFKEILVGISLEFLDPAMRPSTFVMTAFDGFSNYFFINAVYYLGHAVLDDDVNSGL